MTNQGSEITEKLRKLNLLKEEIKRTEEIKITLGEMTIVTYSDREPGIPTLEIKSVQQAFDAVEEIPHTYYLTPFRGYGFQVSGTKEGEGAFGRSAFIGLEGITGKLGKAIEEELYSSLIENAIRKHAEIVDKTVYIGYNGALIINRFAEASHKWVTEITKIRG